MLAPKQPMANSFKYLNMLITKTMQVMSGNYGMKKGMLDEDLHYYCKNLYLKLLVRLLS